VGDRMDVASVLDDLIRHMEWADALVWDAVLASPAARSDAWLRERLGHVHDTQYGFLQVWGGGAASAAPPDGFEDAAAMASWARDGSARLRRAAASLAEGRLGAEIPEALAAAAEVGLGPATGPASMADTVLQVVAHGLYHRGQIVLRLRELGCEPLLSEYFVWVWRGKPAAQWPACLSESAPS
jgi:uncharacterized damage-inducible protein DinB